MKRWGLVVALLVSVGLNLGILATLVLTRGAAKPTEEGDDGAPRPWRPPFEGATSAEGRTQFIEGQRRFMRKLGEERFAIEDLRRQLRRELVAEAPDRERVEQLLAELARRSAELERHFVTHVLETRAGLGPEEERRYLEMLRRIPELRDRQGPFHRGGRPGEQGGAWRERR